MPLSSWQACAKGGRFADRADIVLLLQVDVTAMVPTVVVGLLQHLAAHNTSLRSLRRLVIGGAAAPRSMIETLERWVAAKAWCLFMLRHVAETSG